MKFFTEIGEYTIFLWKVFSRPQRWSVFRTQLVDNIIVTTIRSLPIVALVSIFVGAAIAIQTGHNLEMLIPSTVGFATRESLILEFCSTMIALILAGKVGSSIASEIGSMRISEQVDAIELMGLNSASYLALPKILSLVLMSPFLTLFSIFWGLMGGWVGIVLTDFITGAEFVEGLQLDFRPYTLVYSVTKSIIFAFLITSISAFWGYKVNRGAQEVGHNSTRAVVVSSACILIFNLLLTEILL